MHRHSLLPLGKRDARPDFTEGQRWLALGGVLFHEGESSGRGGRGETGTGHCLALLWLQGENRKTNSTLVDTVTSIEPTRKRERERKREMESEMRHEGDGDFFRHVTNLAITRFQQLLKLCGQ